MHIPENYLSPSTCGIFDAGMIGILIIAVKKTKQTLSADRIPLLGIAAAFSFLVMMFNVPLPGATTGHAICGTLIAILFGPWPATLALSLTLAIQAIFFGDGGVLSLGANCFNIAFVLPHTGYAIYRLIMRKSTSLKRELFACAIASYIALNLAALCTAIEFGIQPLLFTDDQGNALYAPYNLAICIPAMLIGHLTVAGFAEMFFSSGILLFLRKTSSNFGASRSRKNESEKQITLSNLKPLFILMCILIICVPLGLLAAGTAFGEWSLEDLAALIGYEPLGMTEGFNLEVFFPDYSLGDLPEGIAYILSAVIGCTLLILLFRVFAMLAQPRVDFGPKVDAHKHKEHPYKEQQNKNVHTPDLGKSFDRIPSHNEQTATSHTIHSEIPSWLEQTQNTPINASSSRFIEKSILSITSALARFRFDDGRSYALSCSAPAKLLFALACIALTSLAHNYIFVACIFLLVCIILCFLDARALKRSLHIAAIAALLSALIMIPAIFLGQPKSCLLIASKVFCTVSLCMISVFTTPYHDIIGSLARFRVPQSALSALTLALKSIVSLGQSSLEMLDALKMRTFSNKIKGVSTLSQIAACLMFKTKEKIAATNDAMTCRLYSTRSKNSKARFKKIDFLWLLLFIVIVFVFIYLESVM